MHSLLKSSTLSAGRIGFDIKLLFNDSLGLNDEISIRIFQWTTLKSL